MPIKRSDDFEQVLLDQYVTFEWLDREIASEISKEWAQHYAKEVKKQTGNWIHERFRWHGFSYGFEQSKSGRDALKAYLDQWPAKFVIFDESLSFCYLCNAPCYPDFSSLAADTYVSHHNMKWTMVFTHEQPEIGPFFADRRPRAI